MGCSSSKSNSKTAPSDLRAGGAPSLKPIEEAYESVEAIVADLRNQGLESAQLFLGIDATVSNTRLGKESFGGKSLHAIGADGLNPYEVALWAAVQVMKEFVPTQTAVVSAYGEARVHENGTVLLNQHAKGEQGVLDAYRAFIQDPSTALDGDTSFIPSLIEAVLHCRRTQQFTVAVLVGCSSVQRSEATIRFLTDVVARYPMAVVFVGVGDGRSRKVDNLRWPVPRWKAAKKFDEDVRGCFGAREGWRFVDFQKVSGGAEAAQESQGRLALAAQIVKGLPQNLKLAKDLDLTANCSKPDAMLNKWMAPKLKPKKKDHPAIPKFTAAKLWAPTAIRPAAPTAGAGVAAGPPPQEFTA